MFQKIQFSLGILFFLLFATSMSFASYQSPYLEPTQCIRIGHTGNSVKWVQDMLSHTGYDVAIDGIFGNQTKQAVLQFQKEQQLMVDGIVGQATRNALKASVNLRSSSPHTVNDFLQTTVNVNLRQGPGTNYPIQTTLSKGTRLYVYQIRADGWAYAKWNGFYGYISSDYLSTVSTSSLPAFERTHNHLLAIMQDCKNYYADNAFVYSLADGARTIPADKSQRYNGNYCVDCSAYVTWVLYEYARANHLDSMQAYFSYQRSSKTFASIGASGGNASLQVISQKGASPVSLSLAQPGDILVTPGHVEFFDSYTKTSSGISLKVYNCGSNASIRNRGVSTSATTQEEEITYILRVR